MDTKTNKMIETIKKLLRTSTDTAATENEARLAALKAQELMAKHGIELTDVDTGEEHDSISYDVFDSGTGNAWKYTLANIVAQNFCCKFFTIDKRRICFYGYDKNTKVAQEVFRFLFNVGNKLADRYYMKCRYHNMETKGVKNSFLLGYVLGIQKVLDKQCRALLLITPKEVEESYKEFTSTKDMKKSESTIKSSERKSYEEGFRRGTETANSRYIEN